MRDRNIYLIILAFIIIGPFLQPRVMVTEMLIFGIVAVASNIMIGYTGMLSFGQAMFFGIGAYVAGLLLKAGLPLIIAMPAGILFVLVLSIAVGSICVPRTRLYFICITFAFNQMFYFIAYSWTDLTGGEDGLAGIPRPSLLDDRVYFYAFVAVVFLACIVAMKRIVDSPLGLIFQTIRENPERAAAVGYNVKLYKWISFTIASTFTGLAGTVYAMLYSIVPIDQIHWLKSGDFIFMTLLGGTGNFFGPIIGAVAYIWMYDTFALFWGRWPLVMGIVFVVVVIYLRGGIVELIDRAYGRYQRAKGAP
ncbi:MAG: branched-chain amino acid ABC transporter permease [Alphaproteobacteria bacterium]|nr:branched-chain amino acid ABC transporter permease [Alphaproteobacteria bacterium]